MPSLIEVDTLVDTPQPPQILGYVVRKTATRIHGTADVAGVLGTYLHLQRWAARAHGRSRQQDRSLSATPEYTASRRRAVSPLPLAHAGGGLRGTALVQQEVSVSASYDGVAHPIIGDGSFVARDNRNKIPDSGFASKLLNKPSHPDGVRVKLHESVTIPGDYTGPSAPTLHGGASERANALICPKPRRRTADPKASRIEHGRQH